jgi:hypothetical protein
MKLKYYIPHRKNKAQFRSFSSLISERCPSTTRLSLTSSYLPLEKPSSGAAPVMCIVLVAIREEGQYRNTRISIDMHMARIT